MKIQTSLLFLSLPVLGEYVMTKAGIFFSNLASCIIFNFHVFLFKLNTEITLIYYPFCVWGF